MNFLYSVFGDKVQFLWVYIKEAHPSDGSQAQANIDEGIILPTPQTLEQRESYANQAAAYLDIQFTSVIDTMDDYVEALYAAWPLRLHLVGTDGRLLYVGGAGPRNYNPSELESAMRAHLGLDGVTSVSAASYSPTVTAPEAIVAAYGTNLASGTEAFVDTPLPLTLAGAGVTVTDSLGVERPAPLFFVSPGQINFLVPAMTAPGPAVVAVSSGDQTTLKGPLLIRNAAPGLFTANADGRGVAAANVIRVSAGDVQTVSLPFRFDDTQNKFVAVPINMGAETDRVFLVLYGTGIRGTDDRPVVTIGGETAEVHYFGPQPNCEGLDQVNVLLPRSLAGRGTVEILLSADGTTANPVTVAIGGN